MSVPDPSCRYGQLLSSEPLRVNFHPSSLLSIGDLLAFVRDLSATTTAASSSSTALTAPQQGLQPTSQSSAQLADEQLLQLHGCDSLSRPQGDRGLQQGGHGAGEPLLHVAAVHAPLRELSCAEAPPSIEEQMALEDGLTSRIPQRCVCSLGDIAQGLLGAVGGPCRELAAALANCHLHHCQLLKTLQAAAK